MSFQEGDLIAGKYKVMHKIGKGGMSEVYLVMNELTYKQWALKCVRSDKEDPDGVRKEALLNEFRFMRKLHHSNMPSIADILEDGDKILVLMDYIDGPSMYRILKEEGAQDQEDVMLWMKQIAGVLSYLHGQDPPVIYRDLKPSNIIRDRDNNAVLIDFGTLKESKTGQKQEEIGTIGYAAPEQKDGISDQRSDIYSLGVTAYHLLTGQGPETGAYKTYPIRYYDPSLSSGLERIIAKCTAEAPDARYQNCNELLYDLEHYYEYDIDYQKKKKTHLILTLTPFFAGTACLLSALFFDIRADSMEKETYHSHMKNAEAALDIDTKEEEYIQAAKISPSSPEPWTDILNKIYLTDGHFTKEEAETYTAKLNDGQEGQTARDSLIAAGTYGKVAYETGIAYFYYYDDDGGMTLSGPYFSDAAEAEDLTDQEKARAEALSDIASYYQFLNERDRTGDVKADYKTYFKDMKVLVDMDLAGLDNSKTALISYRSTSYRLMTGLTEFLKAGVSENEILDLSDELEKQTDKIDTEDLDDTDKEAKEMIGKNLETIRFEIKNRKEEV